MALISGVKDRDKYYEAERIQGRLKSEAYKYLVNKTLSTVGKIFSLKGRIEIFLNARERDKQKWINCVAEDNLVSLARFYRIANEPLVADRANERTDVGAVHERFGQRSFLL